MLCVVSGIWVMMEIEWFLCWLDCIWCWLFWVCWVSEFIWCFVVFCRIDFLCLCDCMIWIVFDEFLYDLVLFTKSLLTKSSLCFDKNSKMCIFLFSTMITVRCSLSVNVEYHGYYEIDIWMICYVCIYLCDIDLLWFLLSIQMSDFVVKNE